MQSSKKSKLNKKSQLLKIIGKIIKKHRLATKKGILLHAYEFDIPSSSLNLVEHGARDCQITTLWKIANSFGMTFGEFINEVEEQLPENFTLIDN
ncbi:hypothetical protein IJ750_02325 [bacterium]|nr:hypothetical protein [bacterium]